MTNYVQKIFFTIILTKYLYTIRANKNKVIILGKYVSINI